MGPAGVDLTPLRLTKCEQIEFCKKRIQEQSDYIDCLGHHRAYKRKMELKEQAKEIRSKFEEKLKELTTPTK